MKTLPLLMLLATGSALADDAALLRCRAISDNTARVACYDAIPLAGTTATMAPSATGTRAASAAPAMANAAATAATAAGHASTTSAPAAPAAAAQPAEPAWVALPAAPVAKTEAGKQSDAVETSIDGVFLGWVPGQRIRLANGQVWRIEDGSLEDMDLKSPKATLRKGMLGAVYLDIEGAHRSPRVRRVQ